MATWNVHDLFDEYDRTVPPGDQDTVLTSAEVEEKLERVGRVLARIDADLLFLEEVENLPILERLADGALALDGYRHAYLVDGFDPRGIDIGVLSKWPLDRYVSHLEDRDAAGNHLWSRDLVEIHLVLGGRRLVLLGNHFISQLGQNDARRAEQAERARAYADRLAGEWPEALVAVLGDLNASPESASLGALLADGVYWDLGASLPPEESWTYGAGSFHSRIDYILVHRRAAGRVTRFETVSGTDVASASDHRPVVADLRLP